MTGAIPLGAEVRVNLSGRVVARDEMGDGECLVQFEQDGKPQREWFPRAVLITTNDEDEA